MTKRPSFSLSNVNTNISSIDESRDRSQLCFHPGSFLLCVPEPSILLGVLVLGPFMYARGQQLQHWMDMVNTPQEPVKLWHGLGRAT